MKKLANQTRTLKQELDRLKDYYINHDAPENKSDKDYFLMVKNETTPIYQALEEWEEEALSVVKQRKADVHPQQIVSTKENMELLLMHSYYIDIMRKRYMELNHSVHYVFDQLLNDIAGE